VLLRITEKNHDDEDQCPDRRTAKLHPDRGLGIGANSAVPLAVMNERSLPADGDVNLVLCAPAPAVLRGTGSATQPKGATPPNTGWRSNRPKWISALQFFK